VTVKARVKEITMSHDRPVSITRGDPETILDPLTVEQRHRLAQAGNDEAELKAIAATWPTLLQAWAQLAELAHDPVTSYAFARVGYHRGLDQLRGSGWRGSGAVKAVHESNLGFLRSLNALRRAAEAIGEDAEAKRCELFLYQLDAKWRDHLE
jgi:hypothetical protein